MRLPLALIVCARADRKPRSATWDADWGLFVALQVVRFHPSDVWARSVWGISRSLRRLFLASCFAAGKQFKWKRSEWLPVDLQRDRVSAGIEFVRGGVSVQSMAFF